MLMILRNSRRIRASFNYGCRLPVLATRMREPHPLVPWPGPEAEADGSDGSHNNYGFLAAPIVQTIATLLGNHVDLGVAEIFL